LLAAVSRGDRDWYGRPKPMPSTPTRAQPGRLGTPGDHPRRSSAPTFLRVNIIPPSRSILSLVTQFPRGVTQFPGGTARVRVHPAAGGLEVGSPGRLRDRSTGRVPMRTWWLVLMSRSSSDSAPMSFQTAVCLLGYRSPRQDSMLPWYPRLNHDNRSAAVPCPSPGAASPAEISTLTNSSWSPSSMSR